MKCKKCGEDIDLRYDDNYNQSHTMVICPYCGDMRGALEYERTLNGLLGDDGYWCVVCGRYLPADEDGVIAHDAVPHPNMMSFDEEENPQ